MTIAEKLRHLAQMSEQDPTDLHRIAWRLDVLRDEIRDRIDGNDIAFVDALCKLGTNHVHTTEGPTK